MGGSTTTRQPSGRTRRTGSLIAAAGSVPAGGEPNGEANEEVKEEPKALRDGGGRSPGLGGGGGQVVRLSSFPSR